MKRIVWSASAIQDYDTIIDFLLERSPQAAAALERRIDDTVFRIAEHSIGRRGRVPETFEKLILKTPYILVYEESPTEVSLLRIIHQSRKWLAEQWPAD